MRIVSVGRAFPTNVYPQGEVLAALRDIWRDDPGVPRVPRVNDRLGTLHAHTGVERRHFAMPLERDMEPLPFGETNRVWLESALVLGERAVTDALAGAGIAAHDVDLFLATTITGIACPSIDARLMNRLPFRSDCKRLPLFGLGCVAGAAGIARAADHLRAFPDGVVLLLAVELCSLTFQRDDRSMAQMVASGLFGDGAAAVVLVGDERARRMGIERTAGPRVLASRSVFYPDTEDVMGWDVTEKGFRVLLSAAVPEMARGRLAPDVRAFLADHGLAPAEIARWIAHPGGPKVLTAVEQALELAPDALAASWSFLKAAGNLSSASVLLILRAVLAGPRPPEGARGLLFAMGPGFCSELVLLGW
jgi:alkylresorcinol/alkylpyrone synthase